MSLDRFVPDLIKRRFAADPRPITQPTGESLEAAVLFADISGFTPLTERLAKSGPKGAEQLSTLLNLYFGKLIHVVRAHGGEVFKFAGDALLAQWPANGDLARSTLRAAAASVEIQDTLHNYEVEAGVRLSMRLALGAGQLDCIHVGGVLGRWEFFVTGDPLRQLQVAQSMAGTGQVVVSPQVWEILPRDSKGETLADGFTRLISVTSKELSGYQGAALANVDPDLLRSFLPGSVLSRYAHGQAEWLGELRLVTVLFFNLPALARSTADDVTGAQRAVEILQRALYRFEGSINKISVDDKGVSIVGAMGLPPLAHEDDADRAVKAAVLAHKELSSHGIEVSIGVSTGMVFCGAVGNDIRAEYTVMGDAVNLSARLMQHANGGILCEAHTWRLARDTTHFEALAPLMLKGKAKPVDVYRPTGRFLSRTLSSTWIVGRQAEQQVLSERIQLLVRSKRGSAVIFEGEAGIGKSRLVAEALNQARAVNTVVLLGTGDAIERASPYHGWRSVFSDLFSLSGAESVERAREMVLDRLDEEQRRMAPLLNPVLGLELPDNELTAQMTGVVRSDNTDAFLVGLLAELAKSSPLVLIMEDAHWLDSLSWGLVSRVVAGVDPLLLVLSTRPYSEDVPDEYSELIGQSNASHCLLQPLSPAATLDLVCAELGVKNLPPELGELIQSKAEGNPFYSEELAHALLESGAIRVRGDICDVPGGRGSLLALELPDTVQGVVTSRIDRLAPVQRLTLKVASVLGRTFALRMVRDLFPVESDREGLEDRMVELCGTGLLLPYVDGGSETRYTFKHALTQEAVYSLMLFAQRRDIHRKAAEWLEEEFDQDLEPHYARLAHHWLKAEVWPRAVEMLALSGLRAVRESSNREAVDCFTQALALDEEHALGHSKLVRGGWEARIHDAWYAAGRLDAAREAAHRSLDLLGNGFPKTQLGATVALTAAMAIRVVQGFFLGPFRAKSKEAADTIEEAVHLCRQLFEIYLYQSDVVRAMVAGFRTVNLAERIEPGTEFARGFSMMAATVDLFMLPKVGDRWSARALKVAEELRDHSALTYTLTRVATRELYNADWETAESQLERGVALAAELGEKRLWEESVSTLGIALGAQGRFKEAESRWRQVTESAIQSDNQQIVAWGQLGVAYNLAWMGRSQEALDFMAPELVRAEKSGADLDVLWAFGVHAMCCLANGDRGGALRSADRALEKMSTSAPYSYFMFGSINEVSRVYLRLLENPEGLTDEERLGLETKSKSALKTLLFVAKFFPYARPSAKLQGGTSAWLSGQQERPEKLWGQAVDSAESLSMPLELGLAHLEWGRHQAASSPERREHLEKAAEVLDRLGANPHAARARTALSL
jgi:class 3 adenylate cyclase/tetratricopeptide (TPR) repeat protein